MEVETLPLPEALERWCDPALVEKVRAEERELLAYEMDQTNYFQLTSAAERRQPTSTSWRIDTSYVSLAAAWRELEQDLRRRIGSKQIYVQGVQAKPLRGLHPEPIPAGWAGDFKFDFSNATITLDDYRYTAIMCSLEPFLAVPAIEDPVRIQPEPMTTRSASEDSTAGPVWTPKPEDVGQFSDDLILALLEEHAKRVVEGPDAKLIAPGKISLLPLIKRKMQHRAAHGELEATLSAEGRVLEAWIATKVISFQTLRAPTIKKMLSGEYAVLKARSNAAIQSLKG